MMDAWEKIREEEERWGDIERKERRKGQRKKGNDR